MTISSINTNLAALYASSNIGTATQSTSDDVSALSSGNRIVNASTDVAALAAGTGLQSEVNVLNTALSNASQGTSLLQVADGALTQIQSILQRQQAITTSAQSGSLSSTQLGFLDQEFQALTSEIDQLANTTNFNGVNLINGSLSGANPLESASSGSTAANGAATVSGFTASGSVTGFTSFQNLSATSNDTSFYGALSGGNFTVTAESGTGYNIAYNINGSTYTGLEATGASSATLSNGKAEIILATSALAAATSTTAKTLQTDLTSAFSGATAYAIHSVATTDVTNSAGDIVSNTSIASAATVGNTYGGTDNTAGTLLAGLTGANISIQSAGYSGDAIPSISNLTATTDGGTLSGLSLTVDGQTYSTGVAVKGTGNGIKTEKFGSDTTAGQAIFYLNGDSSSDSTVTINFSGITTDSTNVQTADGVAAFVNAVNGVLGSGGSGLEFQVGSTSSQSIGITLGNATSASLFGNVSQNVLTQSSAATAGTAVNTALNTVTSLLATVGADEERFNFASSAIQSTVQNQQAAESNLLDTNVASTSTAFATAQVQLQAGIAVLAQANQLPQNLLKLIQ
jgi:flagellin